MKHDWLFNIFRKTEPPKPTNDPWPADVPCPVCKAPAGRFCDAQASGFHNARFEASPGAHAYRMTKLKEERR